jgi:hypothetical protein
MFFEDELRVLFVSRFRAAIFFLLAGWGFFFGASSCQSVLSYFISWAVQMQTGGQFIYRDLEWREGKIVFLDAVFV